MQQELNRIDHLVYATPSLEQGIEELADRLGVRASPGGSHPGWGTANALLALGPSQYLEIIGPDPAQPDFDGEMIFRIGEVRKGQLVTWAANGQNLESLQALDLGDGLTLGQAFPASRETPAGDTLSWTLTDPTTLKLGGLLPFLIDWGDSAHPAASSASGAVLMDFRLEHPEPDALVQALSVLEIDVPVQPGAAPAIVAIIDGPAGRIELR